MSRLIWICAVCKSLLLSPMAVKFYLVSFYSAGLSKADVRVCVCVCGGGGGGRGVRGGGEV